MEEMERGQVKAESFIGLVQVNLLLPQQLIQVLVFQYHLPQNGQLQKYQKLVEAPSKFANFFHVKPSDSRFVTWLLSFLKFGLPGMLFEVF